MRKMSGTTLYFYKQPVFVHAKVSHGGSEHDVLMV